MQADALARCGFGLLLLAGFFSSAGCTAIDRLNAPKIEGDPADTGLIVAEVPDVEVTAPLGIKHSESVSSVEIQSLREVKPRQSTVIRQLAVFSDLPPGDYQIAYISTMFKTGNQTFGDGYVIPANQAADIRVNIKAGQVIFLGAVTLEVAKPWMQRTSVVAHRDVSREIESRAWDEFLRLYPGSIWEEQVRKRMTEITVSPGEN